MSPPIRRYPFHSNPRGGPGTNGLRSGGICFMHSKLGKVQYLMSAASLSAKTRIYEEAWLLAGYLSTVEKRITSL